MRTTLQPPKMTISGEWRERRGEERKESALERCFLSDFWPSEHELGVRTDDPFFQALLRGEAVRGEGQQRAGEMTSRC